MDLAGELEVAPAEQGRAFAFTVTNTGDVPTELTFPDGRRADVVALEDGEDVWRWSDGRMFVQAVGRETLQPGESLVFHATWPDPTPGSYVAEASLEAREVPLTVRTAFEVE